jgi:hypothetical protein
MSTPISRNNRLQGLELYAPRRARDRSFADDQSATSANSEERESDWAGAAEPADGVDSGQAAASEQAEGSQHGEESSVLDWVDQAIREVVELGHPSVDPESEETAETEEANSDLEGPDSPPVAPEEEDESEEWLPPPRPAVRRPNYRGAAPLPPRRSRLNPEIVPEPVAARRKGVFPPFLRLSLVIAFAAIVAYGVTVFSSQSFVFWPRHDSASVAVAEPPASAPISLPPASRLIVEDQQAFANEPLSLAVNISGGRPNESLLFDGLAQGTRLSAGASTSPSSWQLSTDKLRGLYLYAPKDFVGVMNTTVDLLGHDSRLLDSRSMQLKWVPKQMRPARAQVVAPAIVEASAGDPTITPKSALPKIEPLAPAEADFLMQEGRDSLNKGDISGARVAFSRLADAGSAAAALALADTYDPEYLAVHNFIGVQGDPAKALALYQRAKELGSAEASRILAQMGR